MSKLSAQLAGIESALHRFATPENAADGIDLRELASTLWRGKWVILAVTVVSGVIAVAVVLRLPNQYKATAVLMPGSASSTSYLSRLASQFGGLASLAGLSFGMMSNEGDKTGLAIELIKSWGFQEQFIRSNHLELPVFAAKGWDRKTNELLIDPKIYDVRLKKWVRKHEPELGETAEPNGWELYNSFSRRLSISQNPKTGLVTLSVEFYSPYLAKEWVDKLVVAVNKHLQDQDQIEAEQSIRYLEEKMSQTTVVEMKEVFSRLIGEQTKNMVLTRVSDEYVLKTLSPAKVPLKKSGPKRALFCIAAVLTIGSLTTLFWLMWSAYRRR